MAEYKTFDNLVFEPWGCAHSRKLTEVPAIYRRAKQAVLEFPNGYGVSVLFGSVFYSNGIDTYELGVLKDGHLCYTTSITDDVLGYITKDEVTEVMIKLQQL